MKFILSILAIYAYFSFALLDALKGISYSNLTKPAVVMQKPDAEPVLIAQVAYNKRVSPFTVD
jgi:hypothetical protein